MPLPVTHKVGPPSLVVADNKPQFLGLTNTGVSSNFLVVAMLFTKTCEKSLRQCCVLHMVKHHVLPASLSILEGWHPPTKYIALPSYRIPSKGVRC